jgi:hypothetical protein
VFALFRAFLLGSFVLVSVSEVRASDFKGTIVALLLRQSVHPSRLDPTMSAALQAAMH